MTVSKVTTGTPYFTLTGTLAEVVDALGVEGIPVNKVINIFYNGTNITAVYHVGRR
jgi:hypothetical protein